MKKLGISDAGMRRLAKAMHKYAAQIQRTAVGNNGENVIYFDDGFVVVSTGGASGFTAAFDSQGNAADEAATQSHIDDWQAMFDIPYEERGFEAEQMTQEDMQWVDAAQKEYGGQMQQYQQEQSGLTPGVKM